MVEALFDLSSVCRLIRTFNYSNITLQFPDELLSHSVNVYLYLLAELGTHVSMFIVADSTFGSSVDDVSAMHVNSQVIVYFGSDLSSSGTIPIIVVPLIRVCDVPRMLSNFVEASNGCEDPEPQRLEKSIVVVYEPSFANLVKSFEELLLSRLPGCRVRVGTLPNCANMATWQPDGDRSLDNNFDLVGGLLVDNSDKILDCELLEIWYFGQKIEQVNSIALRHSRQTVIAYNPNTDVTSKVVGVDQKEFKERVGGMLKVEHCRVIGLLVGSMGLSQAESQAILSRLRTLIEAAGKRHYTVVMGRLNAAKLSNFPEIDIYCLISNEDTALIAAKSYHVPVITPYELELGLGALEWTSKFLINSTAVLSSGVGLQDGLERVKDTRMERGQGDEEDDEEESRQHGALSEDVIRIRNLMDPSTAASTASSSIQSSGDGTQESALVALKPKEERITLFDSAASEYYASRSFKGLDPTIAEDEPVVIHQGHFGLARGYTPMPPSVASQIN